jgi:Protein of unknown function (DUF3352)
MRLLSRFAAGLSLVVLFAATATAETPSPLRLVPDSADLLLQVNNPRRLVDTVYGLDAVTKLQQFPSVKELLDSTLYRRYYQFLAYFEKELGAKYPDLLDRLAGGGVVLASKFGADPAPVLLVVQGKDEKLTKKFMDVALDVVNQELARQEIKERPIRETHNGVETIRFGKDFYAAVAGSTLLLSNNEQAMKAALDLLSGESKKSMADVASVKEAAALLPKDTLASLWVNFDTVKQQQAVKEFYAVPRDLAQTLIFGAIVDVLGRTPFFCVGLCQEKDDLVLTVRAPRGSEGMGAIKSVFLPPAGQPGCRPALTPKGVLYTDSFYLDPAPLWTDRAKLFSDQVAKQFEETDKNSGRFLSGLSLNKLLTEAGPYHRLVVAEAPTTAYKTTPKQHIPAFALVSEMRDPEALGRNLETVLRGAALFATTQIKLKLTEETYKDVEIVGYRFSEDVPYKADITDLRFNFTPCFARVGNQFVACSTIELCRELVDLLQKEGNESKDAGAPPTRQIRVFSGGVAELVKSFEDTLVTQTILDQAVPPTEAKAQVKTILQWIHDVGELRLEETYTAKEFHYDLRWRPAK